MRSIGRLLVAGFALTGTATVAEAQSYRFDIGVNGGGSIYTSMLTSDETGGSAVKFSPGWLAGAQATFWATPRIGIRANFSYSDRGFEAGDALVADGGDPGDLDHVNIWNGSGDLLFRLRSPATEFRGGEWLPYVAVGAGARWVNPAGDRYQAFDIPNAKTWSGVPFRVSDGDGATYFLSELSRAMFLVGFGSDVRMARNVALRLEVGDRFSLPFIYEVTRVSTSNAYNAIDGEDNRAVWMHEIYGQAGLHLTLGGAGRAAPVVVAPPPPPPPAPAPPPPAPAPPPAPTEEQITVCVIDPAAAGGIRSVSAIRMVQSGDTMVMRGADRVALRTTVPTMPLVGTADWYVAGRPLVLPMQRTEARYLATGRAVPMSANQLTLVGSLQGMPVYAEQGAVSGIATRLGTINANGPADLAATLRANADIRTAFADIRTLYVPAQVVGCQFQPLQLQEEVRKGGD
jgi:hypothetical protein